MMFNIYDFSKYHDNDYCPNLNNWNEIGPNESYMDRNQQYSNIYIRKLDVINRSEFEWYLLTHLMSYNLSKKIKTLGYYIDINNCYKQQAYYSHDYLYKVDTDNTGHIKDIKNSQYYRYEYTEFYSRKDKIKLENIEYLTYNEFKKYDERTLYYCLSLYQMFEWLNQNNIFKYDIMQSPLNKSKSIIYYIENNEKKYLRTEDNDIEVDLNIYDNITYIINIFIEKIKDL